MTRHSCVTSLMASWPKDSKYSYWAYKSFIAVCDALCFFWLGNILTFLKDRVVINWKWIVINWKLIWSIPSWLILRSRKANFWSQPFESAVFKRLTAKEFLRSRTWVWKHFLLFYCRFRIPTLSLVVKVKGGVPTIQPYAPKVIQSVFFVESMKHAVWGKPAMTAISPSSSIGAWPVSLLLGTFSWDRQTGTN